MTATQWLWADYASTIVSTGGSDAPASGHSENWTVSSSTGFPGANNAASPPTVFNVVDPNVPTETILVTNVSGTTWTVTRGADGTTPSAHTANFTIWNTTSAGALENFAQLGNVVNFGETTIADGLTVTGGLNTDTFVASSTAEVQDGLTVTGGLNTDTFVASSTAEVQDGFLIDDIAAPATPASGPILFGAGGVVASIGTDGNLYTGGSILLEGSGSQSVSSSTYVDNPLAGLLTPYNLPVGTYLLRFLVTLLPTVSSGNAGIELQANSSGLVLSTIRIVGQSFLTSQSTSYWNGVNTTALNTAMEGIAYTSSQFEQAFWMQGWIVVTTPGQIGLYGAAISSGTWTFHSGASYLEITPSR